MRPRYLKATKKDIENSKYRQNGTGRGCSGTTNPGVTQKTDNPLEGIWNPIPWKPDNPLKEIRNIVPNRIWSQWLRGLKVPTQIDIWTSDNGKFLIIQCWINGMVTLPCGAINKLV